MLLHPIVLIGVLLMADGGFGLAGERLGLTPGTTTIIAVGPVLLVLAVVAAGLAWCRHRLAAGPAAPTGPQAVLLAERLTRYGRWALLAHFAVVVLFLGWLDLVRGAVGDRVLIDELLTIAPVVTGIVVTWWLHYPLERRLRDALLVRRLDLGQAVFPTPSRGRFVLTQLRMHLLFLLVPMLLIVGAAEVIDAAVGRWGDPRQVGWAGDAATVAAAAAIVVLAPLLARLLLEVEPVPEGSLRDDLERVCRTHDVKVRRLLVWRTHGSMINAAVMGLFGRLRYVLFTDALLESMSRRQLEAVMAHEIAHIRRHHLPWLLLALLAAAVPILSVLAFVQTRLQRGVWSQAGFGENPLWAGLAGAAAAAAVAATVIVIFGWISRRFERQADAFAVRHLNGAGHGQTDETISPEAVATVSGALEAIATLSSVAPDRPSWRHGSIAWRRAYLDSIVGRAAGSLDIDRQVMWIKGLVAAMLGLGLAAAVMGWGLGVGG